MKTRALNILSMLILGIVVAMPATPCHAQDAPKPTAETKPAPASPPAVYHLVFVVRELDGGKTINSRTYSMSAQDDDWGRVRVGSRVA
ncbi:MAG TPA: hypothetical protein VFM21_03455, partial [Terriglobia bacterium]|nr:hypothetical protein [Terriglobia bacterium]